MDTPQLIHRYHLLIKFSSFLIKLEYYVNLYYLHLYREIKLLKYNTLIT